MAQQYANLALTPAKLLAVNVNGLAGEAKRKAFLQFVMDAAARPAPRRHRRLRRGG
jgi:hypothetical protein